VIDRALVLTAGLGTRLRPLTEVRAKPALPVAGEPMIRRIIAWLVSQGVRDLVLNLHHRPETLTARVGDGADLGARVRYSWEAPVLGSAGGPRRAIPLLSHGPPKGGPYVPSSSTFLIVNGDTLTDVDLQGLLSAHRASGALVTMAVVPNTEPQKYSGIAFDDDGAFVEFVPRGSSRPSWHFVGVQAAEPAALVPMKFP